LKTGFAFSFGKNISGEDAKNQSATLWRPFGLGAIPFLLGATVNFLSLKVGTLDFVDWRQFGWDRGVVRRGRPGLAGSAPSGLVAVGVPAASSLSRIFVRIGNGLNGPTDTISDFGAGSPDCAVRELESPV
jgi:hypothetical protein